MSSAEQMLGMSLDDIIKLNTRKPAGKPDARGKPDQKPAGGRGGRGGFQAARGGASSAGRGFGQQQQQQQPPRTVALTVKRGGVSKMRGSLSTRPIRTYEPIIRVRRKPG
jgi:hypothetical protein